ncbi:4-hydroxythreonine-4-phosphate dehydrogenase PdxA [Desulfamplus magnetovallimortis]|nr:4-hydroxythreonine-4-phosphate dehydrogenase PdxA [Desulfamplus magnetovallimortis]
MEQKPVVGITMGDPCGIGPEIIVSALEETELHSICIPLIIGDAQIMQRALDLKKSSIVIHKINFNHINSIHHSPDLINVLNISCLYAETLKPGIPTKVTGLAMLDYINTAVDLAVTGHIAAMVTAPITKTALKMAGSPFHGHTELIASRTGAQNYAMMLAGERLKVILVTIHIPLSEVTEKLTIEKIIETIEIAGDALHNNFGIKAPRIAVAGVNPHAGEETMFGTEEEMIILPAVKKAQQNAQSRGKNFIIEGPFPPDTIFYHAANGKYDCVVCMYHDQGLIPFKLIHFSDGVNTTLGLPIIRTSVDHGTAYDIAWKNLADHQSLLQAIKMAVQQTNHSSHRQCLV